MLYGFVALVVLVFVGMVIVNNRNKQRQKKIEEQVRRIERANEPSYRARENGMETTIKDGVITYRKRRKRDDRK